MAERTMPRGLEFAMRSKLGKLMQDANVWVFRKTDGKYANTMQGAPLLLLTVRGRKSGKARTLPLIYLQDSENQVIVASKGGWPDHPLWYKNLQANPTVEVQVGAQTSTRLASTANAEERARLWPRLVALYAPYADYQSWSDREIPVVVLSPTR
jgi:deazaflavin-dependent oxidoreductase (nitroreductase family)